VSLKITHFGVCRRQVIQDKQGFFRGSLSTWFIVIQGSYLTIELTLDLHFTTELCTLLGDGTTSVEMLPDGICLKPSTNKYFDRNPQKMHYQRRNT
jgi:hypothetical protein